MMLCSRCKKRVAVVFMSTTDGTKPKNDGLCLVCAKELGIKPINDMMQQMGISDDMLEEMSHTLDGLSPEDIEQSLGMNGLANFPFVQNMADDVSDDADEIGDENKDLTVIAEGKEKSDDRTHKKIDKKKRKFLETYCTNLTRKAAEGALDNIIGREREIGRVIQILSRRTKNNPCLIGEPGVGKTAIAEGIAIRIVGDDVPPKLLDKEIYLVDLTALVAGTQFRGQFESRVKSLVDEVKAAGNIILFIDEVHNLVGTGDSEGTMNAANILKPALSRGEIQVIGATTFNEYRKYIEKDAALERRFQPVKIEEPSVADTINVLLGIKKYYEDFHKVRIPDSIVRSAVILSERYITDRFLPDKAIDLLDEACACNTLSNTALSRYEQLNKKLRELEGEETRESQATPEKMDYQKLAELRSEICRKKEMAKAVEQEALGGVVSEENVAHVIELWTGIPAAKIEREDIGRIAGLEENLKKKIIGQDEAVRLVASAIRRSRVRITARRRPASFIFVGPTGVGKTELVKVLAAELFDNSTDPLIRLDMSEYMEKHSVAKIVGSPPGYVGYDEAGQLTEKVRRRPYSVVLFDEIEKAHADVLNVLLQILDEGRITDSHGRTVNFENTVIVMTSNAGSDQKGYGLGFNKTEGDLSKEKAMKALTDFLRPEFLSRVDEIVVFNQLDRISLEKISALMLEELRAPLEEKGINLDYSDAVCGVICNKANAGFRAARDLRRVIRKEIEDKIATILVEKYESHLTEISVLVENGEIKVNAK